MPDDRTPPSSIPAELPEAGGAVRPVDGQAMRQSLMESIAPAIDSIRQIAVDLGLRPYRVFLMHVAWPNGRRGVGIPSVVSEREILPTPKVLDMSSTTQVLRAAGLAEEGNVTIEKISTRYSEDDLMGLTPDLRAADDPPQGASDREFFWEIREARATTPAPQPRRYVPSAAPHRNAGASEWRITLTKQDQNRTRAGGLNRSWGQA